MVYDYIRTKYNIGEYKFIPIGWYDGCYYALYFAQLYSSHCIHVILLNSALWTLNDMEIRLNVVDNGMYPITNTAYKNMLQDWKSNQTDMVDFYKIYSLHNYIRSLLFSTFKIRIACTYISICEYARTRCR